MSQPFFALSRKPRIAWPSESGPIGSDQVTTNLPRFLTSARNPGRGVPAFAIARSGEASGAIPQKYLPLASFFDTRRSR